MQNPFVRPQTIQTKSEFELVRAEAHMKLNWTPNVIAGAVALPHITVPEDFIYNFQHIQCH